MTTPEPPGEPEPQRIQRVDLQRKVSLKFKEFQGFITEYSENLSIGGMFIRTVSPPPPGTVFDFEFTLGEDYRLIHGIGEVVWVRESDEGFDRPAGMGVRFLSLDPESQKLIERIVAERLKKGGASAAPPPETVPGGAWVERVLGRSEERAGSAGASGPEQLSIGGVEPGPGAEEDEPLRSPPPGTAPALETEAWGLMSGPLGSQGRSEPDPAESGAPEPAPFVPPSAMATSPYARSYGGAAAAPTRDGHRGLVVAVLIVLLLVAGGAVMVLFFPEASVRWLVGGDGTKGAPARTAQGPAAERPPAVGESQPRRPPPAAASPTAEPPVATGSAEPPGAATEPATPPAAESPSPEPASPGASVPRPSSRARPAPPPEPEPAPRPAPRETAPAPAPSGAPFSRVLNVIWEPQGNDLLLTIFLDGRVEEWQYSVARLASPPRELVRIQGVKQPFARTEIDVTSPLAERIRIGFHPELRGSELHVVVDLAGPRVVLDRSEAVGQEIRLYFARAES